MTDTTAIPRRSARRGIWLYTSGLVLLLTILIIATPLVRVLWSALVTQDGEESGLANFLSGGVVPLRNSVILAVCTVPLALIVGGFFAWCTERTDASFGWITATLPILTFLVPLIASVVGWVILLSLRAGTINVAIRQLLSLVGIEVDSGPFNIQSWGGLIFVDVIAFVPLAYIVISAGLRNQDSSLEEAARINRATPWTVLRTVTIPGARPAIAAAIVYLTAASLGSFPAARFIGQPAGIDLLSTYIYTSVHDRYPADLGAASWASIAMMATIGVVALATSGIGRRRHASQVGGKSTQPTRVRLGRWRPVVRIVLIGYVLVSTVLPFIALVRMSLQPFWTPTILPENLSFDSYERIFAPEGQFRGALFNSYGLAVTSATIATLVVFIIAEYGRLRGPLTRSFTDAVLMIPLSISYLVIAVGVILAFSGPPFSLGGTPAILIIAYCIMFLPITALAQRSTRDQIAPELIEASLISGSGPGSTSWRINLPLMLPGLVAGWTLVFVLCVAEATASPLLSSVQLPTNGSIIVDALGNGGYSLVSAVCVVLTITTTTIVLGSQWLSQHLNARRQCPARKSGGIGNVITSPAKEGEERVAVRSSI